MAKLGRVESLDPDKARVVAKTTLANRDLGKDPQAEKAEERARATITLGRVIETYLERRTE